MRADDIFEIIEIDELDCRVAQRAWEFAEARAEEIDEHWDRLIAAKPQLFNGRVLLQHTGRVVEDGGIRRFLADYLETDFKNLIAWRDFGFAPEGVRNCFAMAVLEGADGAFVLGEMAQHTANAGRVYFPSGTPDPQDIKGDKVDLEASVRRELQEETGLDAAEVEIAPNWTLLVDHCRVACMKPVRASSSGTELARRIDAFLAAEEEPELARVHLVRSEADFAGLNLPRFVRTYLRYRFGLAHSG